MQTILWADTAVQRGLGPVIVVGVKVGLRITFRRAVWIFGDGDSDYTGSPEKPYTTADECTTKLCPDYYGHVYVAVGSPTIRLTVAWAAQFSVDGVRWIDVDGGLITGPVATTTLAVRQARAQLISGGLPH
jgi:hypothetical protein